MNFFNEYIFSKVKPAVVVVTGFGRQKAVEYITRVFTPYRTLATLSLETLPLFLRPHQILLFESDLLTDREIHFSSFLLSVSRLPVLVLTKSITSQNQGGLFEGAPHKVQAASMLFKKMAKNGFAVLNFDDGASRELKKELMYNVFTFGFVQGADFQATDMNISEQGVNFKCNYGANSVPIWLAGISKKENYEHIYAALGAAAVGVAAGLNLVQISQALQAQG